MVYYLVPAVGELAPAVGSAGGGQRLARELALAL